MAGLGRIPSTVELPRPARRAPADVVVVGGGVSGIVVASRLELDGWLLRFEIVDSNLHDHAFRFVRPNGRSCCLNPIAEAWNAARRP